MPKSNTTVMLTSKVEEQKTGNDHYIKKSYWCGWKISVGIIIVGHTKFLVKVELTWVQDPRSSPESS